VFIELKKPAVPLKSAFDDNLRDYRGQSVPQLFHPNAFILLSNGSDTKVGTLTSAWEHFFDWKRVADEDEAGKVSLERALRGLLEPARLLDYIENFTVFEEGKGGLVKKTAKNHQVLGVNKSIARLVELRETEKLERKRLGVFWHTQGSGKSLSMVFFTQKVLRKVLGSCTFVIVTDREELDDQISKTFKATGATAREDVRATSAEHLKELLRGNERYIFTLIQKFRNEPGQPYPELSSRSDVIVITDEAHRSQYDIFALNMRNALPNAGFIGFTGTPLIKGEEERTREVFGDYVSVYDFARSIEDGATVPLYYENRTPELQLTNPDINDDLYTLIEEAELDWCGFFSYSPEEGTYAYDLDGAVDVGLAHERLAELRELQDDITARRRDALIGSSVRVLVDETGVARSHREAPEIDGVIEVPATLPVGSFAEVRIVDAMGPDLVATTDDSE
jgi:type I restriction enzyme R subunit